MTPFTWSTRRRVQLPRDAQIAYAVGRMAIATSAQLSPLWYGSQNTARVGFHRLAALGLLRAFDRREVSMPTWYGLAADAAPWVAETVGCDEADLRVVSGISRTNLEAVRQRNVLWVSIALAARASGGSVILALVRPEWELRRLAAAGVPLVPDLQVVLLDRSAPTEREVVWMVELDSATERSAVIKAKAEAYRSLRSDGPLFGAASWRVLFVVPSLRRARTVAAAVTGGGAGAFTFLATEESLGGGHALGVALYAAADLAASTSPVASVSLVDRTADRREP